MPSSIGPLTPPPCPSPQAPGSTGGFALLPDDAALTILQEAHLAPDRLMQLRRTSKQFKRLCEADALWRPWWSCAPPLPVSAADSTGPREHFDHVMRLPRQAREDLAKLWRLRGKQRSKWDNHQVAEMARRHLDHPRLFFLAVELNPAVLKFAPEQYLENDAAMIRAIAANRLVFGYVPQRFREDRTLMAKALRAPMPRPNAEIPWQTDDQPLLLAAIRDVGPEVLQHAQKLCSDVDFMAQAVAIHSLCIKSASCYVRLSLDLPLKAWVEDRRAMMGAIEQNGDMLQYASEPMRHEPEVLVAALRSDWKAIQYAPDWVRADGDLMLQVLDPENISLLDEVAPSLKSDRCFMDRALDVDGRSLSFAAPPLRGDRALVLKSIRQGYLDILEVASSQVRDDRSLMLEAVQLSGFALQYASARLQGDKAFVLQAVQTDGHALGYAQRQLWADRDLLLASYRQKAEFFGRSHAWSEQDSNRLQQSVRIPGFSSDIPAALEADREVVLAYHTLNASLPVCVVEDVCLAQTLRGDQDLIAQLLRLDVRLPLWTLSGAVRSNRALALQAVEVAGSNLQYAAATLRNDPSFVLEALRLNVSCLPYTPRWLRHHKPFMLKACLERELALRWASAPWDDAFNKLCLRQTWSKTRAMGRSVANSGFALRALLGLSGAHKV